MRWGIDLGWCLYADWMPPVVDDSCDDRNCHQTGIDPKGVGKEEVDDHQGPFCGILIFLDVRTNIRQNTIANKVF